MNRTATLAGGCFWCTEAIFKRLKGVTSVTPGYTGGDVANPTYEMVSSGDTGHAEAVQIKFDPEKISFTKLLDVFWKVHDPTTLDRQGDDVGTQYRSEIFYHDDSQRRTALRSMAKLEKLGMYKGPVVTKLAPLSEFYKAEDYHLDYYTQNREKPYCHLVIDPKISKLQKEFPREIK